MFLNLVSHQTVMKFHISPFIVIRKEVINTIIQS